MEIQELQSLIQSPSELIKRIHATNPDEVEADKSYEPETHEITDKNIRKDKTIKVPNGIIDNATGKEGTITQTEKVARITLSLQKLIIDRAVAFCVGVPIEIESVPANPDEETLNKMVRKTLRDNKASFKDSEICELMMKDGECAEIWYSEAVDKTYWADVGSGDFKMRLKIIAPSKGDTLYPIYNSEGDMTGFGRGYAVKVANKDQQRIDLYTDKGIYKYAKTDIDWSLESSKDHSYGKIPITYYSQPKKETADVDGKIARLETLISNHADTNDYNGSPILAVSGTIAGFSEKGETGKVFELLDGGKVEYVTWNNAPESIKMEIENLIDFIYTETRTPNISFKDLKGLGNISGIALKLMFLDAHLKAKKKQNGSYGESVQRRINFLKSAMAAINIGLVSVIGFEMTPKFDVYMPSNNTEEIENMVALVSAGVLSKRTALSKLAGMLEMSPEAIDAEFELLKAESDVLAEVE